MAQARLKRQIKEMEVYCDPDLHTQLQRVLHEKALSEESMKAKDKDMLHYEQELRTRDLEVISHFFSIDGSDTLPAKCHSNP
jgi:hypothetical protein